LIRAIVESVSLFAQQKGVELYFETSVEKKVIGIDEEKFERILLNLLSNAIKFTPKGKKIFVRLRLKRHMGKEMVCIEVADQGIGIPKGKQKLIFERFGQVEDTLSKQAEGTGIGLYLVKLFVEHLGGDIQLDSETGAGSTFRVVLPTAKVKSPKKASSSAEVESKLVEETAIEFSDIYL
jgi:signal transduction histidine kinase